MGDDDFRGGSPLLMLCMSTVFFSVFSVTADPFRAPLRFSRPTRLPKTYAKAENIPPRESVIAIFMAGLLVHEQQ